MKTLALIWATVWSLGAALVDRFRPLDRAGLNTVADVNAFVEDLHWTDDDAAAPIFATLLREFPDLELTYVEDDVLSLLAVERTYA